MARPRSTSDDDFVQAAATAAVRRGDGSWSLADVARVVGVTPAALVKRFGSKRGLLLAVVGAWVRDLPEYAADPAVDPLAHVRAWAVDWLAAAADPDTAVGHLTLVLDEVVDPEARALLAEGRRRQAGYLHAALGDAHERGLLRTAPSLGATQLWLDLLAGVALASAIERSGQAASRALAFIDHDIERWRTP